jgi:hypothetical protein
VNVANSAGFEALHIDEEINGLFSADETSNWRKNKQDSINNIQLIEKTYKGHFPHL